LEPIDPEGKMKALLAELGPVPDKLVKKDDNYFILTINNAAARDFARTMRLLQDPKQFGFFEDEGEDSSDDEDLNGASPRSKRVRRRSRGPRRT
jgi:hypothetical protein